jgi:hypothetical protein
LKYPYEEFVGIFSRTIGTESTTFVPKYILYILHYVVHEYSMIEWAHIISNDIFLQLGSLRKTRKFYMTSYLVFVISQQEKETHQRERK